MGVQHKRQKRADRAINGEHDKDLKPPSDFSHPEHERRHHQPHQPGHSRRAAEPKRCRNLSLFFFSQLTGIGRRENPCFSEFLTNLPDIFRPFDGYQNQSGEQSDQGTRGAYHLQINVFTDDGNKKIHARKTRGHHQDAQHGKHHQSLPSKLGSAANQLASLPLHVCLLFRVSFFGRIHEFFDVGD